MKREEITIATFADSPKAFGTIGYVVLIQKLHLMNFSKCFHYWLVDYLIDENMFTLTIKDQETFLISEYWKVPYSDLFYVIYSFQI